MKRNRFACLLAGSLALVSVQPFALADQPTTTPATPTTTTPPATTTEITIKTMQGTTGEYLTDAAGRSLYVFELDNPGKTNCTGACIKAWPPVIVASAQTSITASGNVLSNLLGNPVTRDDGTLQLTYNNLPLYTFTGDKMAGDTNGQGMKSFGGTWYLVKADGTKLMPATTTPATTPPATTPSQ